MLMASGWSRLAWRGPAGGAFRHDQHLRLIAGISVAQAKAHLSAITRAAKAPEASFDLAGFLAATTAQPLHGDCDAAALLRQLREDARY